MNNHIDQAAGLRRIMSGPQPRIVSILSADKSMSSEKPRIMTNLALAMIDQGLDPLLVNASPDAYDALFQYGLNGMPTLMSVAEQQNQQLQAITQAKQGYSVANLMNNRYLQEGPPKQAGNRLNKLFSMLARQFDVVLVDAELNRAESLPLPVLNNAEIIIQLTQHADSIKRAYSLIKRLVSQLGPRSFGVFITGVDAIGAERVFRNMAQVSKRYLQTQLEYMGSIPFDEHIKRAKRLGRPVIDVFPMAMASQAFRVIAKRISVYASLAEFELQVNQPIYH